MNFILIDTHWQAFLPLSFTKPVSHLRIGIDTIAKKWERHLGQKISHLTAAHLQARFPLVQGDDNTIINSAALPHKSLAEAILALSENTVLTHKGKLIAARCKKSDLSKFLKLAGQKEEIGFATLRFSEVFYNETIDILNKPSDLFRLNDKALRQDFKEITKNIRTIHLPGYVIAHGSDIYIEEGATLNHCVLNAATGPIYIGKNAEIMEGALIRGPLSLGAHSTVKMGAKIYGATTIGEHAKVGGEISNSIIDSFSNKGHDGFLGNSILGSWCNLGADTNTSNLKNNYSYIRIWDYPTETYIDSGLQFHGLIMGDHSKAGINTMFNTGTVVGVCANVFDSGFPPKFIPSFSWCTAKTTETFHIEKAFQAAEAMMARRDIRLDETDKAIFRFIHQFDAKYRL